MRINAAGEWGKRCAHSAPLQFARQTNQRGRCAFEGQSLARVGQLFGTHQVSQTHLPSPAIDVGQQKIGFILLTTVELGHAQLERLAISGRNLERFVAHLAGALGAPIGRHLVGGTPVDKMDREQELLKRVGQWGDRLDRAGQLEEPGLPPAAGSLDAVVLGVFSVGSTMAANIPSVALISGCLSLTAW